MCSPGQRAVQQPDAVGQGGDDAAARGGGLTAAVEQRPHRLGGSGGPGGGGKKAWHCIVGNERMMEWPALANRIK